MNGILREPLPFSYQDYRLFLKDRIEYIKQKNACSFRQICKNAGINSPNYLQRIFKGERHLTVKTAVKIAKSIDLKAEALTYFTLMIQYNDLKKSDSEFSKHIKSEMKRLAANVTQTTIENDPIQNEWLYPVVWEMATLANFDLTVESAFARLSGAATKEAIRNAFNFLLENGYLIPEPNKTNRFMQRPALFSSSNDKKRIVAIQSAHQRYLDLAKHRLNDALSEREFQGLTIAVSKEKMPLVKERLRNFIKEMATDLANDDSADEILRMQCSAFFVTR